MIGTKINHLTVIKEVDKDKWGSSQYLCECECGKLIILRKTLLNRKLRKSCGCKRMRKQIVIKEIPKQDSPVKIVKDNNYKTGYNFKRGYNFQVNV